MSRDFKYNLCELCWPIPLFLNYPDAHVEYEMSVCVSRLQLIRKKRTACCVRAYTFSSGHSAYMPFVLTQCCLMPFSLIAIPIELFLDEDDVRKIHEFEEDCVDDYFTTLELNKESSTEERIKATNQRSVTKWNDDLTTYSGSSQILRFKPLVGCLFRVLQAGPIFNWLTN